jgi:enoyl-CoA hydratase/carnithine racemase
MPSTFTVSRPRQEIARVTFDNPPANLVDPPMIRELHALIGDLEADPGLRAVVFGSARDGRFLGPYDMSQAARTPNETGRTGLPMWLDLTVRLSQLPAVSIAVIRGASRGVGNEFALACDLRFASLEHAVIDQPEVGSGVVPGGGAIPRLPGLAGRARTLEAVLGAVPFDGATADRYGLVNRALPDADLDAFVDGLAERIAGHDHRALAEAKALIDAATLPAQADLATAYQAFLAAAARLAAAQTTGGAQS